MLHKSGIRRVQAGIESLNTHLLKLMCKGTSAIKNIQFLKLCQETGIQIFWNFLYRIPGEEVEYYDEIIKLIPSIVHLEPPAFGRLISIDLHRFSPYFANPEKYGIENIKPKGIYNLLYQCPKVSLDNIAYMFDFNYKDSDDIVKGYINRLSYAITIWQKSFKERKFYCRYIVNNDFIEIEDNRPSMFEDEIIEKRYIIKGIDAFVFLLCDEIQSFDQIYCSISQKFNSTISKEALIEVIKRLKNNRLLYEENRKYINLSIIKSYSTNFY
jgi:hypothetical protein